MWESIRKQWVEVILVVIMLSSTYLMQEKQNAVNEYRISAVEKTMDKWSSSMSRLTGLEFKVQSRLKDTDSYAQEVNDIGRRVDILDRESSIKSKLISEISDTLKESNKSAQSLALIAARLETRIEFLEERREKHEN